MRLALIIPESGFLLDERVFPSLGILKVAASARALWHDVRVIDLSGGVDLADRLGTPEWMVWSPPDAFGLTATMPQMPAAAHIMRTLRSLFPTTRLILGGPHPTLLHASAKRGVKRAQDAMDDLFGLSDVVVCGDGEKALPLALAPNPPQLIDADDPSSALFLTKQDLNDAPFPARDLIDIDSYHYQIDGVRTQSLIAQLGCPFGCNFCGGRRSPFLRRVRTRTTERVIAEMRHLYDTHGTRGFMFLDDELNVNPQFLGLLEQMLRLQDELGVEFKMRGLIKSELLTDEMAAKMAQAGFRQLLIGFESGDPRMLLNMNKHATRDDNTRCVETLKRHGIKVKALMSLGHPGESPDSIEQTRRWLLDVAPDDFDVTIITVYPGTPYYDDAQPSEGHYVYADPKNGDKLYSVDVDHLRDVNFYKGIPGEYQSFVWTDRLSRSEIVEMRDELEEDVRTALEIPYPSGPAATQFEHSMGMR